MSATAVLPPPPPAAAAAQEAGLNAACSNGLNDQPEQFLVADLAVPLRGIAPGQIFVMYDGPVCLGSATIMAFGPTLAEQQQA
jgi:tRNA U34 2-thiouridine synthase MnmA/TrmU